MEILTKQISQMKDIFKNEEMTKLCKTVTKDLFKTLLQDM